MDSRPLAALLGLPWRDLTPAEREGLPVGVVLSGADSARWPATLRADGRWVDAGGDFGVPHPDRRILSIPGVPDLTPPASVRDLRYAPGTEAPRAPVGTHHTTCPVNGWSCPGCVDCHAPLGIPTIAPPLTTGAPSPSIPAVMPPGYEGWTGRAELVPPSVATPGTPTPEALAEARETVAAYLPGNAPVLGQLTHAIATALDAARAQGRADALSPADRRALDALGCPAGAHPVGWLVGRLAAPVDLLLYCPACDLQHVDAPSEGWSNPPHRSHRCREEDGGCGHVWRPADVATNGVASIATKGSADSVAVSPGAKTGGAIRADERAKVLGEVDARAAEMQAEYRADFRRDGGGLFGNAQANALGLLLAWMAGDPALTTNAPAPVATECPGCAGDLAGLVDRICEPCRVAVVAALGEVIHYTHASPATSRLTVCGLPIPDGDCAACLAALAGKGGGR